MLQHNKKRQSDPIHACRKDTIFVPFAISTINENRVKNADIVAAITKDQNVSLTVSQDVTFSENPEAKKVRIDEETVFTKVFTVKFKDVVRHCRKEIPNWKQDKRFYAIMRDLKKDAGLHRTRLLDPGNPKGSSKDFYSKGVFETIVTQYSALKKASYQFQFKAARPLLRQPRLPNMMATF